VQLIVKDCSILLVQVVCNDGGVTIVVWWCGFWKCEIHTCECLFSGLLLL